jgi:hypothetical protein
MSVVITRRQDGESLGAGMRLASREPYQLAAFQAGDYFVYAVSDLPPKENAQILTALAPSIQNFL